MARFENLPNHPPIGSGPDPSVQLGDVPSFPIVDVAATKDKAPKLLSVVIKKPKDVVLRKIETFKVKGVNYIECVKNGKNSGDKVAVWPPPSSPPFTTWSGLMLCPLDSTFANRLVKKCGGLVILKDGTEAIEENKEKAAAILGFWTAPEHWPSMLTANDGIEDPLPCSSADYPKPSFLPSWV
jgi:hypothetical protein